MNQIQFKYVNKYKNKQIEIKSLNENKKCRS